MRKATKQVIQEYVEEVGEFEKEHRKYSSFYASCWLRFEQEHIDDLKNLGIDASQFLGVGVTLSGMWDDSNGSEWHDITFESVEQYEELVPEKVIPAHYVTKEKVTPFTPDWS